MNLEYEIIGLSNKVRFNYRVPLNEIVSQAIFIVSIMKHNTKEISLFVLDVIISKYRKILSNQEFFTLQQGVYFLKVWLLTYYNSNDICGFINDCFKEWLKDYSTCYGYY